MSTTSGPRAPKEPNNLVAEWFGHRVYPTVAESGAALADQRERRCPFLSEAIGETTPCVKAAKSSGVCTISSRSNGPRQDWLVCPYRALDPNLVESAARRMFGIDPGREVSIQSAPTLGRAAVRADLEAVLERGGIAIVYVQDKIGGEISLSATDSSPELSFDVTLVELVRGRGTPIVARYAVLEVQTMDFHGSYSEVVRSLTSALELHEGNFHKMVRENPSWLAKKIEGPNIANVFKRTLYQMLLKFRLAGHGPCAGVTLAIPASVWDSWQRHLGAPELTAMEDGTFRLDHPSAMGKPRAWLYVFDLDARSTVSPSPIVISKIIGTDADAVAHYAFKVAPEAIIAEGGSGSLVLDAIRVRLTTWWPDVGKAR
jgi:Restriction endonuclease NotI